MTTSLPRRAGRIALLVVAVSLCGACQGSPAPSGETAVAPSAPTILVAKVTAQPLVKMLRLPGELNAYRNVGLYAKVQGFVDEISVDRGSEVKQGEILVRLSAPELADQRRELAAKLAADESTYRRMKDAAKTPGVVAGNDLETLQQTVEGDRSRLAARARDEAYLLIEAPFDGVVTERNVHEGSIVGINSATALPMLRLQEITRLRLVVNVPEAAVGGSAVGSEVRFSVTAYPGETFTGTVARPAYSLDTKTRTMPVEVDVKNPDKRLAPGMFTEVLWEMHRPKPSLFVPVGAVATTTERRFVVRVRDGVSEWVDVAMGQQMGGVVEVFGELSAGDLVAVRGTDEIRPQTKVVTKEAS